MALNGISSLNSGASASRISPAGPDTSVITGTSLPSLEALREILGLPGLNSPLAHSPWSFEKLQR
jgi:hypothetical protein